MELSPELRLMVSAAQARLHTAVADLADPIETKRAEILARQANADHELALLSGHEHDEEERQSSIRAQLAWLGFQKATKRELRDIIMKAMGRDPDA